jgi:CubicO group peptidase (beta-lactamase class C family)
LVHNGNTILKKGYGSANLEYGIPNTPSTVFHIASISKQFTVFAILLLEEEGKLSLEDDIRKWIPEVPDFGKTITLRHLANHTSGLRDQWSLLTMAGWRMDDVITKEQILKLVAKQKELNFEPGEEYLYCNTGFTLLAEVVARVSGKTFAEFTQEKIFEPLQMNSTLFYDDHEKIVKNRAYSYKPDGDGYKKSVLSYANVGATSLFTTVEDLSLWSLNFKNPKVGSTAILEKMNTEASLNNGEKFGGALGQFINPHAGLNMIHHGGADAGYRTYMGRFPEEDFAVIVFSNDGSFSSQAMALKVADIYLEEVIAAKGNTEKPKDIEKQKLASAVKVDTKTLKTYVGEYELEPMLMLTITEEKGILYGQPTGQEKRALTAISKSEFAVESEEAIVSFFSDANKAINRLELKLPNEVIKGTRVEPFDPKAVLLTDFTGPFYSEELGTEYIFSVENGQLIARHSRMSDVVLLPVKNDMFSGDKFYLREVTFIRDENQAISGYKVSNGRVRNLWFSKVNNKDMR